MSRTFVTVSSGATHRFHETDLPLAVGADGQLRPGAQEPVAGWLGISRGYLFLQPEPGADLLHNESKPRGSVWIKSGDVTRIGDVLLQWRIAGDLVELRVREAAEASFPPPREDHAPARSTVHRRPLPRVRTIDRVAPRKRRLAGIAAILLTLSLAAVFVVIGRSFEVRVEPPPERLRIHGPWPVIRFGERMLAPAGRYQLVAERPGYHTLEGELEIGARHAVFTYVMIPEPGRIRIETSPATGASVEVAGEVTARTPATIELPAGLQLLTIRLEGYREEVREVLVAGQGREQLVEIALMPDRGKVTLQSKPSGARLYLGEELLGETPFTGTLAGGRQTLRLELAGFQSQEIELDVAADLENDRMIELEPLPATIRLATNPPGALVRVDGRFAGQTPLTLALSPKTEHALEMTLEGFAPSIQRITPAAGSKEELSIEMKALSATLYLVTDPADALLEIDGQDRGPATGRHRVAAGRHHLTVHRQGYATLSREVQLKTGVDIQLEFILERQGQDRTDKRTPALSPTGRMLPVGPGRLTMGASRQEPGRRANEQERVVLLQRPVLLARHEVTNGEYRRFRPEHRSGLVGPQSLDMDNQPVVGVSWEESARYCNWLSSQEGLAPFYLEQGDGLVPAQPATTGYRLPTEAEWAYAARIAGRQQRARYPWEGDFPPRSVSGNYGDESARGLLTQVIAGYDDQYPVTAPVGTFPANSGGFSDLGGNVSEWCHDYYVPYTAVGSEPARDPLGPDMGSHRVIRGSNWRSASITELRLSYRGYGRQGKNDTGFRVARYSQ